MNILNDKSVKTRKPHLCWGCEREFPAGTTLRLVETVDTEGFSRAYWCRVCQAVIADWDPDDCEYITRGDVRYGDPDIWEQYRDEIEAI